MKKNESSTLREEILDAALKVFAQRGYAGGSIQDIVDQTTGSKPSLYYHFKSKEALYEALLAYALDEAFARMQKAAARSPVLEEQLVEVLDGQFKFLKRNPDLLRLAFAAAFASPGELPQPVAESERGRRGLEFVHSLIQAGLASGALDTGFDSVDLANGFYGALCYYLMLATVRKDIHLDRQLAHRIVRLFLAGAGPKTAASRRQRSRGQAAAA
jgi:AcrR family transcriptional regulator